MKAIEKRGGAKPGQKTMLDALEPACRAMDEYVKSGGSDACSLFGEAMKKAESGAEESRNIISSKGRSKGFKERTIGIPDPGAVSVSIIFRGLYEGIR